MIQAFLIELQQNLLTLYGLTIIFGLCIGSFLNVVIYRVPIMLQRQWQQHCAECLRPVKLIPYRPAKISKRIADSSTFNLCTPRSQCPHCHAQLAWWHNIPVVSYLCLSGRCHYCQHSIAWRYPFIELITAVLSLLVVIHFGVSWQSVWALLLSFALICLTMIDIDHQILPDWITLPLLWCGLLININHVFCSLTDAVIGAVAAYLSLWLLIQLYYLMTGKIGMGTGDFKLFAALGAWLGWQRLPWLLVVASLLGAIIGMLFLKIRQRSTSTPIPFGPFLAIAALSILLS